MDCPVKEFEAESCNIGARIIRIGFWGSIIPNSIGSPGPYLDSFLASKSASQKSKPKVSVVGEGEAYLVKLPFIPYQLQLAILSFLGRSASTLHPKP